MVNILFFINRTNLDKLTDYDSKIIIFIFKLW